MLLITRNIHRESDVHTSCIRTYNIRIEQTSHSGQTYHGPYSTLTHTKIKCKRHGTARWSSFFFQDNNIIIIVSVLFCVDSNLLRFCVKNSTHKKNRNENQRIFEKQMLNLIGTKIAIFDLITDCTISTFIIRFHHIFRHSVIVITRSNCNSCLMNASLI